MMPGKPTIYLDIETEWDRTLTVLGFHSTETGTIQLVGDEITALRLRQVLPKKGRLVTFNGHCFDLPVIRTQLGIDLRSSHDSVDLRYVCARCQLTGGQKLIEQHLGIDRSTDGVDGREAIRLWQRYLRGDNDALDLLLEYNEEDLLGMKRIESLLKKRRLA
jgi:uncharacterized protein YprB with RNaseH-like and TPR domain